MWTTKSKQCAILSAKFKSTNKSAIRRQSSKALISPKKWACSAYAACRKHETVLKARKVWQILVKVSLGWDHADIQDGGLETSYWVFLCLHDEVPAKKFVRKHSPAVFKQNFKMVFANDHANEWFSQRIRSNFCDSEREGKCFIENLGFGLSYFHEIWPD